MTLAKETIAPGGKDHKDAITPEQHGGCPNYSIIKEKRS